ncbi:MAG: 1-deoxy-D-xylulose-5-phosphate synthase [Planctomycetes bacterium]|nr:1-deoxy-D-xylulose-5-phosphate synthase [Planctomycetota bacterium]
MTKILDNISSPEGLRLLSLEKLTDLADEVRHLITDCVSQTGGHLASNLGVIELTIAMHYVFDFKKDKLLWDVGHQCYAHKILTQRGDRFHLLRQQDGLSGFPCPDESEYDLFSVGHAGTAISTALGMALAAQQNGTDERIVSLVGDASIVNGLSFEALNNMSLLKRQMLVVLNDNSMAIDATEGSIAKFLSKVRLSHTYEDLRKRTENILEHLPVIGKKVEDAIHGFTKTLRMAVTPNRLFDSLNIPYFGPVDGHDIGSLVKVFKAISELNRPCVLHVYTKKGHGFSPAGDDPSKFHSTGPFDINGKTEPVAKKGKTFTQAFSDAIVDVAAKDERVIAITAAMTDGTGLAAFRDRFGERFYDVGIAESAAVDIAAGLAKEGLKPIVCIYSTFLQRAFDQIFQEVSLQNLPVIFCIDRGGLVGNDGPTHHGMLDIGFLRMLPNMVVIAPSCESELKAALDFAIAAGKPVAIRYPKDFICTDTAMSAVCGSDFVCGESLIIKPVVGEFAIVAIGACVQEALKAGQMLQNEGIDAGVIDARFAKPIDDKIIDLLENGKTIITVEDHSLACGFGSAVLEKAAAKFADKDSGRSEKMKGKIVTLGCGDKFIKAAPRSVQLCEIGVSAEAIAEKIRQLSVQK